MIYQAGRQGKFISHARSEIFSASELNYCIAASSRLDGNSGETDLLRRSIFPFPEYPRVAAWLCSHDGRFEDPQFGEGAREKPRPRPSGMPGPPGESFCLEFCKACRFLRNEVDVISADRAIGAVAIFASVRSQPTDRDRRLRRCVAIRPANTLSLIDDPPDR
jgi:hypothetical protein